LTRPWVVLVGPPGAGKSTVGRLLAQQHALPFRDTDADVEAAAGTTVSDIFVEQGEQAFRRLERSAVGTALAEHTGVLALGGGAVLDETTRAALSGHRVAFLDVTIDDAARRIGFNRDRPLLLGNPRAQWRKLMAERRPVYAAVATITVDTDGRSPQQVADDLTAALA
jgi:shikimate kinase